MELDMEKLLFIWSCILEDKFSSLPISGLSELKAISLPIPKLDVIDKISFGLLEKIILLVP